MQVTIQTFNGHDIRVFSLFNKVYFVGEDVAKVLGYSDVKTAGTEFVWSEYTETSIIPTINGLLNSTNETEKITLLSEYGVYQLIYCASPSENPRLFQEWIINIMIPSMELKTKLNS